MTGGWFNELDVWPGAPPFNPEVLETPGHYALAGLVELIAYRRTGNPAYLNEATYVANYLLDAQARSTPILAGEGLSTGGILEYSPTVSGGKWTSRSNDGIAMWFLVEMYKQTGNTAYLNAARAIADFNYKEPRLKSEGETDGKYPQLSTSNAQLIGGHTGDFGFNFGAGSSIIGYLEANMLRGLNALRSVDPSYNQYFTSTAQQLARMQMTSGGLDYYWTINFNNIDNPDDDTFTPKNKEATRANSAAKDLREAGLTTEADKLINFIIENQQPSGAIYSPQDGHANRIRGNARSAIALIENGKIEEGTKVLDFILTAKLGAGQYPDKAGEGGVLSHYSTAWVGIALSLLNGAVRTTVPAGTTTTVNALTDANTQVDVTTTTGTPTVTVAWYPSNPGGAPTFTAVGLYYDVSIDSVAGVDSVKIRFYYTDADIAGFVESSLRAYWWTGTTWTLCSPQALYTEAVDGYSGYIEVGPILAAGTTPTLNQLVGTPFGVGGKTPAPPPAAKYLEVELRLSSLEVDVSDGPKTIHVTADASTSDGASAYITYMWSVSGGELNVEQDRFVEASSVEWILTRVGGYSITCVARSQGYSDGEDTASVTAIPEMDLPLRALCGTLILLYILLWKIRWRLPVNTSSTRSSPVLAKAQI